jgi:hypothetical protein
MMRFIFSFLLLIFPLAAGADLTAGNWEVTATTTIEGMGQPTSLTQTRCLSAEDARDPSRLLGGGGASCNFTDRNDTGSVFTFQVACTTNPPFVGQGTVRYSDSTLDGEVELRTEGFRTQSRLAGRRLGPCS